MSQALRQTLRGLLGDRALFDEPMSRHTTWKVGGPAWCLCRVRSQHEVVAVVNAALTHGFSWKALGAGSNLLVKDAGYGGVMLRLTGSLAGWSLEDDTMVTGAGLYLMTAAKRAAKEGLSGLEWAIGIPGTVGGAIATNAGAFGSQMSDLTASVTMLLDSGKAREFSGAELAAGYRHRAFPQGGLVLKAKLRLGLGDAQEIATRSGQNLLQRSRTQPLGQATAGSVFKNPPGDFAGRLMEQAGLKGLAVGPAVVSSLHANFIINRGGASAAQVLELMDLARHRVRERFGVDLEPEVEVVGDV